MAESKKKPESKRTIIDVTHPDDVKPSDTSKPVIVGHKPILKDPMVVEDKAAEPDQPEKPITKTGEIVIKPLSETEPKDNKAAAKEDEKRTIAELAAEADAKEIETEPSAQTEPEEPKPAEEPASEEPVPEEKQEEGKSEEAAEPEEKRAEGDKQAADPDAEIKKKEEEQAKHDDQIQELADSKKYFLPINAVEQRRSKRVIMAGVLLSLILALAWVDVALDAGLIDLGRVKPITHFFSN